VPEIDSSSRKTEDGSGRSAPWRWLGLDVFRALAVLSMMQGHTFTALLAPHEYDGGWVQWHSLIHGLTAPMFLLGGGLAYGLVNLRRAHAAACNFRLVRRAFELIVIGFLLQLPKAPLQEVLADRALLAPTVRVGPLQLVGVCLLLCELLRVLTRTRGRWLAAIAAVTAATAVVAPLVWQARPSVALPLPLGTWFDGYAGSQFPLFPWAAFFLLGVLATAAMQPALRAIEQARRSARALAITLMTGGVAAAVLPYALFLHGHVLNELYGKHELWHTSPLYVLFRTGVVLAWLGVLCALEPRVKALWLRAPWVEQLFSALSKHSLLAYVTHLLLLYGTPFTVGLVRLGTTLDKPAAVATTLYVIAFTTAVAVLWEHYLTQGALARRLSALFGGYHVEPARTTTRLPRPIADGD
jgi:uncharacterized membrane protein